MTSAMHATLHHLPAQPLADCSTATWRALQAYVGRPYEVGAFDCADLAVLVQREVFDRAVHLPTHPQGGAGQRAAVLRHRDALAHRVAVPFTGAAVLLTDVNGKGDEHWHIGTTAIMRGEVWVLHNSYSTGGVRMDTLADLQAWGMRFEGFYAWN